MRSHVVGIGRLVAKYGSIEAATAEAPILLGYLAKSVAVASKLPTLPKTDSISEIGEWAAGIIRKKPDHGGHWQKSAAVAKADAHRPSLGMRATALIGTDVMAPTAMKTSRDSALKRAVQKDATVEAGLVETIDATASYASFNDGFGTQSGPVHWNGRSKRPRQRAKISAAARSAQKDDSSSEEEESADANCVLQ
jgi:hypothetical protein